MARYVLKILVDLDALDDLDARKRAAALVTGTVGNIEGVREIVLHATTDHKSIKLGLDGSFIGQWNKGGPSAPPGEVKRT